MAPLGAGFRGIDVANVAGIRAILRHAENTENVSRLVGGGASLQPTCLCLEFPGTGKNTGKIVYSAPSFMGTFKRMPISSGFPRLQ